MQIQCGRIVKNFLVGVLIYTMMTGFLLIVDRSENGCGKCIFLV